MDTQKIARQIRVSGWAEAVKERMAGGQTVDAFCEGNGISKATYYYRQKKVREAACAGLVKAQDCGAGLAPDGWAQLTESKAACAAENGLAIEIGGYRVIVDAATDPELLAKVCRVLRSL